MRSSLTFYVALVAKITSLTEFFLTLLTNEETNKPSSEFLLSKEGKFLLKYDNDLYKYH